MSLFARPFAVAVPQAPEYYGRRLVLSYTANGPRLTPQAVTDVAQGTWEDVGEPIAPDELVGTWGAAGFTVAAGSATSTPATCDVYAAWQVYGGVSLAEHLDVAAGTWALTTSMEGVPTLADTGIFVGFGVLPLGSAAFEAAGIKRTASSYAFSRTANNSTWGESTTFADATGSMLMVRKSSRGLNAGAQSGTRSGTNPYSGSIADSVSAGNPVDLCWVIGGRRAAVTASPVIYAPEAVLAGLRLPT